MSLRLRYGRVPTSVNLIVGCTMAVRRLEILLIR
jgi:hypothetical protein